MDAIPVFLSVVLIVRNREADLGTVATTACELLGRLVSDFEVVLVDNASTDGSVRIMQELTANTGLPNLQVYALTKEVDADTAAWVGLENALGDFVAVLDPSIDDLAMLPEMLDAATRGSDVVFASNAQRPRQTLSYRFAYALFSWVYQRFAGVHLEREAPSYRLLSKRVINFILRHPQPAITYRHLPASGGFARANLTYSATPMPSSPKMLRDSVERGMRLLVSTTRAPMRLVTALSMFGAIANLLYSVYVVVIAIFKRDVAPGWTSTSLQQSGMFFLISLVLLVLGEYILHMASLTNEGPAYHVAQEFTSARILRRERLNIEESDEKTTPHVVRD